LRVQISLNSADDFAERQIQRLCQLIGNPNTDLYFAEFDGPDVSAMNSSFVGKLLLRLAWLLPSSPDFYSEKH
jgi:hypothetical protein